MAHSYTDDLRLAHVLADNADSLSMDRFLALDLQVDTKPDMTYVTESDEAVDKLVLVVEALNALTDLTNAEINANPAAIIKDLARECKTIARQANREARLTSGRTEDTFTGTEVPET